MLVLYFWIKEPLIKKPVWNNIFEIVENTVEYLYDVGNTIINMGMWKCDHMVTK